MVATTVFTSQSVLELMSTPDRVGTRLGLLKFRDGAPSEETAATLYDTLDFLRGVEVFPNAFQGVSTFAIWQGFLNAGVADNSAAIFSELMDPQSVFLTANADTTLRHYSPLQPFFDKTWRPSEIEAVS